MSQGFGMESPSRHVHAALRKVARYLVVIESGGHAVARLFSEAREQVAEFDASTEETASMTCGQVSTQGATGPDWAQALAGHSLAERAAAEVYVLNI
jgi:single-stranded DNA-specific DHH superfamily exonuclease